MRMALLSVATHPEQLSDATRARMPGVSIRARRPPYVFGQRSTAGAAPTRSGSAPFSPAGVVAADRADASSKLGAARAHALQSL